MTKPTKATPKVTMGSGNVFADLGLPDPEIRFMKSMLAIRIGIEMKRRRLDQAGAAALLGIDQPRVSKLLRGRLDAFSIDKLMKLLVRAGKEIEIVVRDRPKRAGKKREAIRVTAAA